MGGSTTYRPTIGVGRVRYRTEIVSDQSTGETEPETFELVDVPSEAFVGIGTVSSKAQRSKTTYVVEVEQVDGTDLNPGCCRFPSSAVDIGSGRHWQ